MDGNMNNELKVDNKKKIYLSIGVIVFLLLLVGATYAYLTYSISITNGNYSAETTCFIIDYDTTNDDGSSPITGTMYPSSKVSTGLSGKVSLKIQDSCVADNGLGTLTLNVTTADDILVQTVSAHCENSQALESMIDYTTSETCTAQTNGIWVTNGAALKYAVFDTSSVTNETVPLSVGYVNEVGSIDIYDSFSVTKTAVTYYVYIWLDGYVSDNSYANLGFEGNISASAIQTEN